MSDKRTCDSTTPLTRYKHATSRGYLHSKPAHSLFPFELRLDIVFFFELILKKQEKKTRIKHASSNGTQRALRHKGGKQNLLLLSLRSFLLGALPLLLGFGGSELFGPSLLFFRFSLRLSCQAFLFE